MKSNPLNNYATEMAEINLGRNPTAVEVILVLCDQSRDHYQDAVSVENYRVKKRAIVRKNPSMHYVQFENTEALFEDTKSLPWTVSMTVKDIKHYEQDDECNEVLVPCIPKTDDQILIDGMLYTISMVEPSNRYLDGIINCFVYTERSSKEDPLAIYRVDKVVDSESTLYSVVWGGNPMLYCFGDGDWKPFASYFRINGPIQPSVLCIKDGEGEEIEFEL